MLWGAAVLYAVVYFVLGVVKYGAHRNFVDLGIFAQTTASAFGCFCNPVEGSHWAFHFSPVLYLVGIDMHVWRSALTLVAVQAVAGALTVPPIYGIVRRYADRKTALLTSAVVLLYAPLGGVVFNDFHENGLAPAAIAWLLWAFDGGYVAATLAFAALALAIKEDQAIFLAAGGALGTFAYRRDPVRFRLALGIAVASVAVLALFFAVIQPHANANPTWAPARFFGWSAPDPIGRLGYLLLAFVPLLFIPFRSRYIALAVLPLIEVLASAMPTTYTMGSHYAGAWIGYVLAAFALAVAAIAQTDARRVQRLLYWCIGLCVLEFAVANPLHPGYFLRPRAARDVRLDNFLSSLPTSIDVATQEEAYTHLAATDPNATVLPESPSQSPSSCYLLTDGDFPDSARLVEFAPAIPNLRGYTVVRRDGAITLYRSARCP